MPRKRQDSTDPTVEPVGTVHPTVDNGITYMPDGVCKLKEIKKGQAFRIPGERDVYLEKPTKFVNSIIKAIFTDKDFIVEKMRPV